MENIVALNKPLVLYDLAVHGNSAWFCNTTYCALFRLDLETFQIELETFLPSDWENEFCQYGAIAYYNGKLILAPLGAERVLIYDLFLREIKSLKLDLSEFRDGEVFNLFASIYIYQGAAFLLPGRYPAIVRIDLSTYEIRYIKDWYRKLSGSLNNRGDFIFYNAFLTEDGTCILPCCQNDNVLEIHLGTEKYEIFSVGTKGMPLGSVIYIGGIYWFSCREDPSIIKYDRSRDLQSIITLPDDKELQGGIKYLLVNSENVYTIPVYGRLIARVDKDTGRCDHFKRFEIMDFVSKMENQNMPKHNITCCKLVNSQKAILFSVFDGKILEFDLENENVKQYEVTLAKKDELVIQDHLIELYRKSISLCLEHQGQSLKEFISFVSQYEMLEGKDASYRWCGTDIFNYVKNGRNL